METKYKKIVKYNWDDAMPDFWGSWIFEWVILLSIGVFYPIYKIYNAREVHYEEL
jgi:hypothetical protein